MPQLAKPVTLTLPLKDNGVYLGDISASVFDENRVLLPSGRLLDLMASIVESRIIETLRGSLAGQQWIAASAFEPAGIQVRYNPRTLELALSVPAALRMTQTLPLSRLPDAQTGGFERPARLSAYTNVRGAATHVERGSDPGWSQPVFFLDSAARLGEVVLENEMIVEPHALSGHSTQRQGTRLVYDDRANTVRWTALDLQTVGRGFQSPQDMAGLSVFRSYSLLEPQTFARPRGDRRFSLQRPSSVEVYVNDQVVRRLQLGPGSYDLTDFPFARGANTVRLVVTDDSGHTEILRFNLFVDQTQLAPGLSEFGAYAGVKAPLGPDGPEYAKDWQFSGFYRRGISEGLTLGTSLQADSHVQMIGLEALTGAGSGIAGANLGLSNSKDHGAGYALAATFQKSFARDHDRLDMLNLSFETRSKAFAPLGMTTPNNPYSYELGLTYSRSFGATTYGSLDGRYSGARAGYASNQSYRASAGWRITPTAQLSTDLVYQDGERRANLAATVSLTLRLGAYSSARGDFDTRDHQTRLAYQTLKGAGVGAYNLSADLDHTDFGSSFNLAGNYTANRAELGLSHFSTTDRDVQKIEAQRTTVRFATAVAFADGAVTVGRPVTDGFVVFVPYRTLKGARLLVDPSPYGYQASSGWLGPALSSNLAAFSPRLITIDAPAAPAGVDLGKGAYRLLSPYHAGYRLQVGSEYFVTAIGSLLDADAQPLSLASGTAVELSRPSHEPQVIFTNREGRFGLSGLRPGRWLVRMTTQPDTFYELDIAETAEGIVTVGALKPARDPQR